MSKKIALLGSTGSIGTQVLDIVRIYPDRFRIIALTAGKNRELLEQQITEFSPEIAVIASKEDAQLLQSRVAPKTRILYGNQGITEAVNNEKVDIVINALVGSFGLGPTCQAIIAGKQLALANKESLVTGGNLVTSLAAKHNVPIIPIDSEHSAIFQCLNGKNRKELKRILLTASGGPFRELSKSEILKTDVWDALKHPNWNMGKKITIDSATMMNKGLEVIEAVWLFDVTLDQVDVVIHPQSIIHSMVEFCDTTVMAQLGKPDMKVPIQYALTHPLRLKNNFESLSFVDCHQLTFEEPDEDKFPCLRLAKEAIKIGGTMPCVLNKANDILVEAFLSHKIAFYDVSYHIERLMQKHQPRGYQTLDDLLEVEAWVESDLRF